MQTYKAYLINLERSPQRLALMAERLAQAGLPWERVPAIDGRALNIAEDPRADIQAYTSRHGKVFNPAELGCYLSHLQAMQAFLKDDVQFGLILEDDCVFPPNIAAILQSLVDSAGLWDVAKLSGIHGGTLIGVATLPGLNGQYKLCVALTRFTGANCYLVSRVAAQRYLAGLLPMRVPYDHEFDRAWVYGLRMRVVSPVPCLPHSNLVSTIGGGGEYAKVNGLRRLSTHAYRGVNEVTRMAFGVWDVLRSSFARP